MKKELQERIYQTDNELKLTVKAQQKEVLVDEECCTCINIILKNDGQIMTSFLGAHNPEIVKQLERAQRAYFKEIKKTLKVKYKEVESCGCSPECTCGPDCNCTPENHCGCGGHCHEEKVGCGCGHDNCKCKEDKCECGDNNHKHNDCKCGCIDKKSTNRKKEGCNKNALEEDKAEKTTNSKTNTANKKSSKKSTKKVKE